VKRKIVLAVLCAVILSGCVGTPDAEGWRSAQKDEFLNILETDKYASICDQQALYAKVKESENSKLMTKLLVAYTKNLANGCIVDPSLPYKEKEKTKEGYGIYLQKVSESDIKMKLKAGQSIEKILKPYIPTFNQFSCLIKAHARLQNDANFSADTLHKIRLNIERTKLMKPGIGDNYALINIPEYVVRIIEDKKTAVMMNVVVGTRKMKTPIFSEDLSYITLNPQWNVPDSIARNEVIPDLLKDPDYLKKNRMVMRPDYNLKSKKLSPSSVNLNAYVGGKGYVPFKFIEVPSEKNALGRVKFIFPNHHSVYMHDTQSKNLFSRKVRAYSHGCVRLAKPSLMLDYVSKNYTSTAPEEIQEKYESLKTHYVKITKRLPVHTAYFTTYMDECNNLLQFDDVYRFDTLQKLNFK
jgi:hypothetical protein